MIIGVHLDLSVWALARLSQRVCRASILGVTLKLSEHGSEQLGPLGADEGTSRSPFQPQPFCVVCQSVMLLFWYHSHSVLTGGTESWLYALWRDVLLVNGDLAENWVSVQSFVCSLLHSVGYLLLSMEPHKTKQKPSTNVSFPTPCIKSMAWAGAGVGVTNSACLW